MQMNHVFGCQVFTVPIIQIEPFEDDDCDKEGSILFRVNKPYFFFRKFDKEKTGYGYIYVWQLSLGYL